MKKSDGFIRSPKAIIDDVVPPKQVDLIVDIPDGWKIKKILTQKRGRVVRIVCNANAKKISPS